MKNYQKQKEKARQKAVEWQKAFPRKSRFWGELAIQGEKFRSLARRYGLVREFRENGII